VHNTDIPGICPNPVDQTIFIKVHLMRERNSSEVWFRQLLDKVETSSFIVVPLLSDLYIRYQRPMQWSVWWRIGLTNNKSPVQRSPGLLQATLSKLLLTVC